jgi:Transmembrane proteins 14C
MGTLCIVGGVTGYARTRSIPSIVAGIGCVLAWYLRRITLTLRSPRHRACSVGALYLYSGDSIRKNTANGLETALGEYLLVFKPLEMPNPNDSYLRCLGSFIPILSPKICQGSDASGAYCHVSRDRRILRPGDIQTPAVGGGRVSSRTVGTCHCSDFCIICNHRVRTE